MCATIKISNSNCEQIEEQGHDGLSSLLEKSSTLWRMAYSLTPIEIENVNRTDGRLLTFAYLKLKQHIYEFTDQVPISKWQQHYNSSRK